MVDPDPDPDPDPVPAPAPAPASPSLSPEKALVCFLPRYLLACIQAASVAIRARMMATWTLRDAIARRGALEKWSCLVRSPFSSSPAQSCEQVLAARLVRGPAGGA
ncbi:hypothetical protein JX265_011831 [Neoarthrinium moseri]|uniref:Uncharacterized protein n=1 Tax=Neoarthrinium moseri TaxID=1658444 RepID=A0A9P9WBQ2_9PEZI|nr:uncharacterized protein JN550_010350 [Neoarthrinium moseri]KAI1856116.1 hypothetical protein JX265_011831 [Neoarthrinium moseri]KAI1862194.1 hypothetical protein JN550_010350 [Neoarthrinium moseri]